MLKRAVVLLAVLAVPGWAWADEFDGVKDLNQDDKASIENDLDAAKKSIDEKYQGDNSREARNAKSKEYQEAEEKVLNDHGTDKREYFKQRFHESPNERQDIKNRSNALSEEKEKKAKEAKEAKGKSKDGEDHEIPIQKGFGEDKPLELESNEKHADGEIPIQKGFSDSQPLNLNEPGTPKVDENGNPMPTIETGTGDDTGAAPPPPSSNSNSNSSGHHHKKHHSSSEDN